MFIHTPGVALPTRPRRVKTNSAASGIYCTIIIINHTDLFNFFSFFLQFLCQFEMRYHAITCFVEISCVHARLHAHVNLHITYNNIQATHLCAHIHN